jgi:hypothetical protein
MLTDVAIKALKPKEKDYKVADRDGMYVHVTTKGALSFRMDYRPATRSRSPIRKRRKTRSARAPSHKRPMLGATNLALTNRTG